MNHKENIEDSNGEDHLPHILDIYKLHVEMADRISHRRGVANTFYITLHTSLMGALGFLITRETPVVAFFLLAVMGVALSCIWKQSIKSYKQLNAAKFKVINAIEKEHLPITPYIDEYTFYKEDKRSDFSDIEAYLPKVLMCVYGVLIVLYLSRYCS